MKKIILLFGAFFALFMTQAQDRGIFVCKSTEACSVSVGELLNGLERVYQLKDTFPYDNKYILEYKGAKPGSTDSVEMRVVFLKRIKGANPAMEIEGETVYELQTMYGKYLDLFPIWKKYVDTSADIETLAANGYSDLKKFENTDGGGEDYRLRENSRNKNYWDFKRSFWTTVIRL